MHRNHARRPTGTGTGARNNHRQANANTRTSVRTVGRFGRPAPESSFYPQPAKPKAPNAWLPTSPAPRCTIAQTTNGGERSSCACMRPAAGRLLPRRLPLRCVAAPALASAPTRATTRRSHAPSPTQATRAITKRRKQARAKAHARTPRAHTPTPARRTQRPKLTSVGSNACGSDSGSPKSSSSSSSSSAEAAGCPPSPRSMTTRCVPPSDVMRTFCGLSVPGAAASTAASAAASVAGGASASGVALIGLGGIGGIGGVGGTLGSAAALFATLASAAGAATSSSCESALSLSNMPANFFCSFLRCDAKRERSACSSRMASLL
mmetsp:Transcript_18481/g.55287  ORF Transcript_18481/g.55287 Transcript_18481/m.55287 type:complete len:322 (-) Transcript_18481:462-1427(-)